jgi:hypothetical protein
MRLPSKLLIVGASSVALLQIVRPSIPTPPVTGEVQAPPEILSILRKDCYSCHSNERRLAWFDQPEPIYWLVRSDILAAREHLNFSTLGSKPAAQQKATLFEAVNQIQLGAMPLPRFLKLHPEAKVTAEDLAALKSYLAPWSVAPNEATSAGGMANAVFPLSPVQPEYNGLALDSDFKTWKPISTTDRGDNNTFRSILGNDIAQRARESGHISPWPDGTRFAKIAWQQERGPGGLIRPGKFVQVEIMVKDARQYKATDGWGWGRWRGLDMKPYGKDAQFVNECTGCHEPVRGNDYVYTLPITATRVSGFEVVNNRAALPARLPYQPFGWSQITMYVDPVNHTMATLSGNDGPVLALVTWMQREDPHWFGARIPAAPTSIEFLQVDVSGKPAAYRRYAGDGTPISLVDADEGAQRTKLILGLPSAQIP